MRTSAQAIGPWLSASALLAMASAACGQVDPASGIDFVTITNPGNPNWAGGGTNNNRGAVDYEYRIGRFEVTTAQWAEFMNAALDRPSNDRIPNVFAPTQWGAVTTVPQHGGMRFAVPAGKEMIHTGGVDWRTSAIYCNWLHNGKASNREAFLSGAYDVSTFGYDQFGETFTDQLKRSPGAKYFIPSLDEWMKAAHWSPTNPNNGGWYLYANRSDSLPTYGPPGVLVNGQPTTSNSGWMTQQFPGYDPFNVSLGAYAGSMSPWGLFDTAGGTSEWTEYAFTFEGELQPRFRNYEGSGWNFHALNEDHVRAPAGSATPTFFGYDIGFRVAAAVPAPSSIASFGSATVGAIAWRRCRKQCDRRVQCAG